MGVLVAVAVVSLWTPLMRPEIAQRWFSWPNIALLAPVPVVTLLVAGWAWRSLHDKSEAAPFIAAACLFALSYLGIAISLWPMIVPYSFTLWDAASAPNTEEFMAVGTLLLLPVVLMYTAWSSRGKVQTDTGYH